MKLSTRIIFIFLVIGLNACANQGHAKRFHLNIDRPELIISMSYTQRQLINILLNPLSNRQSEKNPFLTQHHEQLIKRRALFIASHCDLIHRDIVYASIDYPACHSFKRINRFCISDFHHCIATCPSFKRDCPPCEQKAMQCLAKSDNTKQ